MTCAATSVPGRFNFLYHAGQPGQGLARAVAAADGIRCAGWPAVSRLHARELRPAAWPWRNFQLGNFSGSSKAAGGVVGSLSFVNRMESSESSTTSRVPPSGGSPEAESGDRYAHNGDRLPFPEERQQRCEQLGRHGFHSFLRARIDSDPIEPDLYSVYRRLDATGPQDFAGFSGCATASDASGLQEEQGMRPRCGRRVSVQQGNAAAASDHRTGPDSGRKSNGPASPASRGSVPERPEDVVRGWRSAGVSSEPDSGVALSSAGGELRGDA